MYESSIDVIQGEIQMQLEGEILRAVQNVGVYVDKEELLKALAYDRNQYEKGYADAEADLDLLISEFLVPMEIDNVCEDLSDAHWGLDAEDETWCSRNCGVTNDGKCPAINCYKEWIKMKKVGGRDD